ncbi:MAG: TonB-dependent receptor [Janthinobacterium lividum]
MKHRLLTTACALALPGMAAAQDAAATNPSAPPAATPTAATAATGAVASGTSATANDHEIIITATRRSETLSNVPIAVSAIGATALENSGANDIRALNQLAPSLLVSSTSNESNATARIRGIGTVGDNPGLESSVAVFIDGVYRSRTGSGLNDLGDIERIEVLRGPQGTLFGRNASAGLINIITVKPSFEFGGDAEATYGNYSDRRIVAGLTGPIIADTLAFRIDGVYNKRDGLYKNIVDDTTINNRNRYFVRGQLLFTPTPDISLRLIGDYTHRNERCCAAVFTSTAETAGVPGQPGAYVTSPTNRIVDVMTSLGAIFPTPGDPYSRQVAVDRSYRNTTTDWGGSGQLDWKLGDVNLTSITAYRQYKAGDAGDFDYSNLDIAYRADDGNSYRRFRTFTQEVRLQGSLFGDRLDWLVGGFYSDEKLQLSDNTKFGTQYGAFAACRVVATVNPATFLRDPTAAGCLSPIGIGALTGALGAAAAPVIAGIDRLGTVNDVGNIRALFNQDSRNYAFFTHNILKLTDRLSVTLGARYTHEHKSLSATFDNDNTACPAQQAALGPLLGLGNPALTQLVGGIITLTCTGNSSSTLNALDLQDKFSESQFTGTGVLSWKPIDDLLVYASYAKGYKAGGYNLDNSPLGGPNGVFSPRTDADVTGLRFDPEKVDSYEAGLKYKSRNFTLNVAGFREQFRNFQLNTFNGTVFVVQDIDACATGLNGGDTDQSPATGRCTGKTRAGVVSQGVEIESAIYPARDVAVALGYTYADTHYRHNLVGSSGGAALDPALFLLAGSQVSNAPKHVVTTSFGYTPDIGGDGMSALFYVDSRLTSKYNTGSDLLPEKEQPAFVTVNARIGIRGRDQRWALEFWGQNILDANYRQVAFSTPFEGSGSVAGAQRFGGVNNQLISSFLGEPRTYGATIRTRF